MPSGYSVITAVTHLKSATNPQVEKDPEVEQITFTISNDGKEVLVLETARYRTDGMRLAYSASPDRSTPARLVDADHGQRY